MGKTDMHGKSVGDAQIPFRKQLWSLIRPYWKSEERWMARLLLTVVVGLSLAQVYLTVLFNGWNNDFYNSLQEVNKPAFWHAIIRFSYLATTYIVVQVYKTYLNQMLRIKWRRWMTMRYLSHWLFRQNYYRMQVFGNAMDNPDQRISEDIDQFIQLTLGLALEGLSSVVTLFSFLAILWELSGPLVFAVHGINIHIDGYMFWVALIYAAFGTWITFRIGRPLIALNFQQQRFEADFRYSLVRLREYSESVAFYKGEAQEEQGFVGRVSFIVGNWWQIMRRQKIVNWVTYGYGQIAVIFPYMVAAPRYFAGEIKLGGLMQTASAFSSVQGALSFLIDSYTTLATWKAVSDRLNGFNAGIAKAEEAHASTAKRVHREAAENAIDAKDLTLRLPNGDELLRNISFTLAPGDSVLFTGPSGLGKSTLLRALAGLWPFVEGTIAMPEHAKILFLPQKPYLPMGSLKAALCYPNLADVSDADLQEILSLCGLEHLREKLDETVQWSNILSLGEQQRVAFARILIARPEFLFLDEATSALDEKAEVQLYQLLKDRLPAISLASTGHRESLRAWHDREINLAG